MKFYLYKVRLNQGGYDSTGKYFGTGMPLYYFEPVDENPSHGNSGYLRAYDREQAKNKIATSIPDATFYK